ncbi:MAG: hypothetical protein NTY86_00985 [Deltaproteobacteria bacterium]|nr:hypothetical protein [Deltaproteobacteria bacterium]
MPRLIRGLILFIGFVLLLPTAGLAEESYSFDASEIEKKSYHFGGYVELRPVVYGLDRDSALYKLRRIRTTGTRPLQAAPSGRPSSRGMEP